MGADAIEGLERSLERKTEGLVTMLNGDREMEVEVDVGWGKVL